MAPNSSTPLTSLSATEMAGAIRDGELSSVDLVAAHIQRIEDVNERINALVVPLFDEAMAAAEKADQARKAGAELGPLHGVPVSIKEFFDVRGTRTTAGIETNDPPADDDSPLVARLRAAGAVVLGKTNVPQVGIAIESENPVYGRTCNPWDLDRSSGGSSGGEGALIAAGGSPLGLGSDGGGSIRIPSHFNGLCGLKPTTGRLTMRGHWQFPAFPAGWSVPGPLARTVDDLELAMNCLVAPEGEPLDPTIAPGRIRASRDVDVSGLTIGYYDDDRWMRPSPAIRRACEASLEVLRDAGATVVPFEPASGLDSWELQMGQFGADGGRWLRRALGKSTVDPRIKKALLVSRLPTAVRRALPALLDTMGQESLSAIIRLARSHHLSAFGFQVMLGRQQAFREEFLRRLNEQKIDVLICPPFASVAMKHLSTDIVLAISYTQVFNLLGMPAGVVPVTTVQAGEESDRAIAKDDVVRDLLRAEEGSEGMPVGVQVVARHWREDVALSVMRTLHQAFVERSTFPSTPVHEV